jgi:hypothetical protein
MKEREVHHIPRAAYAQPLLTTHEAEIVSEFQKEMLEMQYQGLLQLAFGILALQAQELSSRILKQFDKPLETRLVSRCLQSSDSTHLFIE